MAHIELSDKGLVHPLENFSDGVGAFCPFAVHIFRADGRLHIDAGHAGALLATVVLLFHHQVKLVQTIARHTILIFIIGGRFEQANHRHAALVF